MKDLMSNFPVKSFYNPIAIVTAEIEAENVMEKAMMKINNRRDPLLKYYELDNRFLLNKEIDEYPKSNI
jgi:hypothetical protein